MRKQKLFLIFLFFNIFWMIGISVWATQSENVLRGISYLMSNRWGIATLSDTYFAFWIIYLWLAYKEKSWLARLLWFVLVCTLGTIAISTYLLLKFFEASKLSRDEGQNFMELFLLKPKRK